MIKQCLLAVILLFCVLLRSSAQEQYQQHSIHMEPWKKGYLDIHQVATGRGNCTFLILPDGTKMVVDIGDMGNVESIPQEIAPATPNNSLMPAQWVARYIKHFAVGDTTMLDYVFLTHFHLDHMGGIYQLAEYFKIGLLVDRGFPGYNSPSWLETKKTMPDFSEYLKFISWQRQNNHVKVEKLAVGSDTQFRLKCAGVQNFSIRGIYCDGQLYNQQTGKVVHLFPEHMDTTHLETQPNENILSGAIKLQYGHFTYFTAGDITGMLLGKGMAQWRDVETPIAKQVGRVDIAVADHHGYSDGENVFFVQTLNPKVFIFPVWDFYHPQPETFQRMIHNGRSDKLFFATSLVEGNRVRLGKDADLIGHTGHIIIRVYPEGKTYQIFVIDPYSADFKIRYQSPIITSGE